MGILYGRETEQGYEPSWWHRFFTPAVSGNTLNGLGETEVRRPTSAYHRQDSWHPWRLVQDMFYIRMTIQGTFVSVMKSHWLDFTKPAPIADKRVERTPEEWAQRIKDYGIAVGVDKVRITKVQPEWVFEGDSISEKYVIILATRMDYEALSNAPKRKFSKGLREVMAVYYYGHRRARKLADWLREQGWAARGLGNPMGTALNILPAAIEAGIGELGKHGSLICPEMGSLLRLAYVLTDLPVAIDAPADAGVEDFCATCQVCVNECPPDAIYNEKQMVRGVKRWYVDFDKCVPYFNENSACGICLAVCPWSLPGRGPIISQKMLRRRARLAEANAAPAAPAPR
jgi:epoxyqueuosine reductase QueG